MEKVQQWQKIKEIVAAAQDREPRDRSAFLDQACSKDGELRAEVESLLAADAEAGALSENPWATTVPTPRSNPKSSAPIDWWDDWVSAGWGKSGWRSNRNRARRKHCDSVRIEDGWWTR